MVLASDEEKLFRPHAYPTPQGLGGEQVQGPLRQWESAPTKGSGVPAHSEEGRSTPGRKTRPLGGGSLGTWIRKALPGLEGVVKTTPGLSQLSTRNKPSQKRSLNTGKYLLTVQKTRHPKPRCRQGWLPGTWLPGCGQTLPPAGPP